MSHSYSSNVWFNRLHNANRLYQDWETRFKCITTEDYYRGFQWRFRVPTNDINYNPYTINLFYSTIKTKLAGLIFQRPSYLIAPSPGNMQWDMDFAVRSATIKQDALNAIIRNKNMNFAKHCKRAARDSFFRFGMIEVGYAADWRNPQKEDPLLKSWNDDDINEKKDRVLDDNEVPLNERFYVKRVNPRRFRCSVSDANDLNDHEWVGYYDYYYTRTLKKTEGIKWPSESGDTYLGADYATGILADTSSKYNEPEYVRLLAAGSISKVWRIWDLVSHNELLLLDGNLCDPLWEAPFERLPLIDIRWDEDFEGFLPMPPAFQWISPQNEINEAREQTRSYRRRFTRKFQAMEGAIAEEEKEKFASGPDGVIITVKRENAITPIQNPEQGQTAENALLLAKDDFNVISGTSNAARGQIADRETATQSKIVDMRSQIRESAEQLDFSTFLCEVGREILAQASEKLIDGMWIKYTHNPSEQMLTDMQINQPVFNYITSQDLSDGYDFEIEVDIQNATPAAMEQAKQAFMTFVAFLQNYPMISLSPVLIREAAFRIGYRNERVIQQMQQAAVAQMMMQQLGGQATGGGSNNSAASTQVAQQATPDVEAIQQQVNQQLQ